MTSCFEVSTSITSINSGLVMLRISADVFFNPAIVSASNPAEIKADSARAPRVLRNGAIASMLRFTVIVSESACGIMLLSPIP